MLYMEFGLYLDSDNCIHVAVFVLMTGPLFYLVRRMLMTRKGLWMLIVMTK